MPNDTNNTPQNPFNPFTPADDVNVSSQNNNPIDTSSAQVNQMPQQAPAQEEYPQDQRIVDYLVEQVIPTKNPDMPADKVVEEKDRLYKILENGIFDTAYSQLNQAHKDELDTLMKYGADIPAIQAFFIEKIPDIQVQLGKYMEDFVQKYLKGEI